MEELKPIDKLFVLFDERDRLQDEVNNKIAVLVAPTVLTALYELFEVETWAIKWVSINLEENVLLVVVNVEYTSGPNTSRFLKQMDKAANAAPTARVRTLRVGIPVDMVFNTIDEIKKYLIGIADKVAGPVDDEVTPQPPAKTEFNASELTKEQLEQLMLFQQIAPGETQ